MITKRITKHKNKSECGACLAKVIIYHLPTMDNAKLLSPPSSHLPTEIKCSEINVHLDNSSINPKKIRLNFFKARETQQIVL